MTDSIADLLAHKNFDEPPEMAAIKAFVQETFQEDCEVLVREHDIVISVRGAALANSLRLKTNELRAAAKTAKRITFRIR